MSATCQIKILGLFDDENGCAITCDAKDPRAKGWALMYDSRYFSHVKYDSLATAIESAKFAEAMWGEGRRALRHQFQQLMNCEKIGSTSNYG